MSPTGEWDLGDGDGETLPVEVSRRTGRLRVSSETDEALKATASRHGGVVGDRYRLVRDAITQQRMIPTTHALVFELVGGNEQ